MRPALFLRLILALLCSGGLLVFGSANTFGQALPMNPLSPIAPKDYKECSDLQRRYDELYRQVDRMHEDCLEAHQKAKDKSNPESGSGPGSTCSYGGCQSLHNRKYEVSDGGEKAVNYCRAQVRQYQEESQRRKDEEERRLRKAEEERLRREQEREQAEEVKRKKAEDDASRRNEAARERERKREIADTNRNLREMAAEESQRNQEALRERTEERRKAMDGIERRKLSADERFNEAAEERTQRTRDELSSQIAANARKDTTVFAAPPSTSNPAGEFDLSPLGDSGAPNESGFVRDMERMISEAAPADGRWRNAWDRLSNGLDNLHGFSKEKLSEYVQSIPNMIIRELNPDGNVVRPDPLKEGVSYFVRDALKEQGEPYPGPTLGGWVKDRAAKILSHWGANELRGRLNQSLYPNKSADPVQSSYDDLWRAAHPSNLSRGVKPYLDKLVEKWSAFWGMASDRLVSDQDR